MKNYRYILLLIITMTISFNSIWARNIEQARITPEEMQEKKWEYIRKEAKLTTEEAELVKPLFTEYEDKIWQLHEKHRQKKANTDPNYEEINESYIKHEIDRTEYLKEYHAKLKKVLSPEKLYNYYHAEKSYKRCLINEMKDNRPHKQGRGGK